MFKSLVVVTAAVGPVIADVRVHVLMTVAVALEHVNMVVDLDAVHVVLVVDLAVHPVRRVVRMIVLLHVQQILVHHRAMLMVAQVHVA